MKNSTLVNTGKSNLELLKMIQSNLKLSRKELVNKIVNHPSFIYKGKNERSNAWDLVKKAKKSTIDSAYKVIDSRELWICWYDFTMVFAK